MQEAWKHAPVDQGTLLVLLALADSADERSRSCYPGIDSLAEKSRLSDRQVQYCLKRLRELGVISIQRNASPVKTNLYKIERVAKWLEVRDAKIAPHGSKPDTQSDASRDEVDCVSDTKSTSPKPSVTVSIEPSEYAREKEPSLFSEYPTPAKKPNVAEMFERFWKVYPKKEGKKKASENFARAIKAGADPEAIIAGARRYASACVGQDSKFIKWPQGWLTDERWNDGPPQEELTPAQIRLRAILGKEAAE